MIRFFIGLIVVMGAVGADETASTLQILSIALVGLAIMFWGVCGINQK